MEQEDLNKMKTEDIIKKIIIPSFGLVSPSSANKFDYIFQEEYKYCIYNQNFIFPAIICKPKLTEKVKKGYGELFLEYVFTWNDNGIIGFKSLDNSICFMIDYETLENLVCNYFER